MIKTTLAALAVACLLHSIGPPVKRAAVSSGKASRKLAPEGALQDRVYLNVPCVALSEDIVFFTLDDSLARVRSSLDKSRCILRVYSQTLQSAAVLSWTSAITKMSQEEASALVSSVSWEIPPG